MEKVNNVDLSNNSNRDHCNISKEDTSLLNSVKRIHHYKGSFGYSLKKNNTQLKQQNYILQAYYWTNVVFATIIIIILKEIKITFPSFFLRIFLHVPYEPVPMVVITSKSSSVDGILGLFSKKKKFVHTMQKKCPPDHILTFLINIDLKKKKRVIKLKM